MAATGVPAEPRLQPRTGRLEPRCPSRDLSQHDDPNFSLPPLRPSRARPLASRDAGMPGPDPLEQRGRGAHAPGGAPGGHGASRARGGDRGLRGRGRSRAQGTGDVRAAGPGGGRSGQKHGDRRECDRGLQPGDVRLRLPAGRSHRHDARRLPLEPADVPVARAPGGRRDGARGRPPRRWGRSGERAAFPLFLDMRGADWTDPDAFRLADGARRFENWEFAYALVSGLGAAARYALAVGAGGRERAQRLAAVLRQVLAEIPGVRVLDRGRQRCAIVSVDVAGRDAADLKLRLRQRGINASSADRMSGGLDMDDKGARSVLRFSPHYYNTEDELNAAVGTLAELARS